MMKLTRRLFPVATVAVAASSALSTGSDQNNAGDIMESAQTVPAPRPASALHVRHSVPSTGRVTEPSRYRSGKRRRSERRSQMSREQEEEAKSRFYDWDSFSDDDKRSFGDVMGQIDVLSGMVDWEALKDRYVMASISESSLDADDDDVLFSGGDRRGDSDIHSKGRYGSIEDDDALFEADFGDLEEDDDDDWEEEDEREETDQGMAAKVERRRLATAQRATRRRRKKGTKRTKEARHGSTRSTKPSTKRSKSGKKDKDSDIDYDESYMDSAKSSKKSSDIHFDESYMDSHEEADIFIDEEDCVEDEDWYHEIESTRSTKSSKSSKSSKSKSSKSSADSSSSKPSSSSSSSSRKSSKKAKNSKPACRPTESPSPTVSGDLEPTGEPSDDAPTSAPFAEYTYARGNCPDAGSTGLACPPDNLRRICDKYDPSGSFRSCLEACKPSFCCIHDALSPPEPNSNYLAPNCLTDENCAGYSYCYIVWWKMHDTIGPAIYLRIEQDDDFYDVDAEEIEGDQTGDTFYEQFILHHFDDVQQIIDEGTDENGEFRADTIFDDPTYWETDI